MSEHRRWSFGLRAAVLILLAGAAPACVLATESVPAPNAWTSDAEDGVSYTDDFVGILTDDPEYPLHVEGYARAQGYFLTQQAYVTANGADSIGLFTSSVARLTVQPNGTVLIPDSGDATNDLQVNGLAAITQLNVSGACMGTCASDARLKKNVAPLSGALGRLLGLRGVTFEWKDPSARPERDRGVQTGFLAQEVEAVFPEWVLDGGDGYKRLQIRGFEALSVEAFRALDERGRALAARVTALEEANGRLAAEVRDAREKAASVAGLAADLAAERAARAKLEARLAALEAAIASARRP